MQLMIGETKDREMEDSQLTSFCLGVGRHKVCNSFLGEVRCRSGDSTNVDNYNANITPPIMRNLSRYLIPRQDRPRNFGNYS